MTLTPAYGRNYKSGKAAKEAFLAGKDFVIADMFHKDSGRYVSVRDLPGGASVTLRFNGNRGVTTCKVPRRAPA